jgi:PleD family two-component response regulator
MLKSVVAERIRAYVGKTIADRDSNCEVTVSIGCIQITEEEDLARVITRSDDALYSAKNKGRNQVATLYLT